jgi:3-methyl-2-oxobutanoate hydroxymethyltransferase
VLVINDLIGMTFTHPAKFVRRYSDVGSAISEAVAAFRNDVVAGSFPSDAESYHLPKDTAAALEDVIARKRAMR